MPDSALPGKKRVKLSLIELETPQIEIALELERGFWLGLVQEQIPNVCLCVSFSGGPDDPHGCCYGV